jgi:16S rRNA processing protein RimM
VRDEAGVELGKLTDVLVTGANDVYLIKPVKELGVRELLLPALASVVLDVDLENGVMTVAIPPGLLDE